VSVLGPLTVTGASGASVRIGGHRVRELLIMLALEAGRPVSAASLIDRLWPDDRPGDAVNALQSLISRLRAALRQAGCGDAVIESDPAGYRLAISPQAVDAIAFEAAAREGSRALAEGDTAKAAGILRDALAGWRGPALSDVADAEFAAAPAARLTELRTTALLDRIEAGLALGEAAALTGELRAIIAADPLAERPVALLMRALAATGRQSEALSAYTSVRDQLANQLGVDPSAQLEQVYLAILRHEIPAAVAVKPPVPTPRAQDYAERKVPLRRPPTSFVGRDDDVAGILKKLSADRLVTLTGPGGVGKTRLATELAGRLDKPAWLAPLAPVTDPADVPYAVLEALGLRERSISRHSVEEAAVTAPVHRIVAALADRDVVLLLDNCEHVIDAAAELAETLLTSCPRMTLLATSREPLRIPGEALYPVSPLPVPPADVAALASPANFAAPYSPPDPDPASGMSGANAPDIPEISTYPAVRLFTDRASAVLPEFELSPANAAAVIQICRALDGMPLAVELATPWLRTLTPEQLAERLNDRFALLTGGSRTALPRHQTLRAVVDWSWQLLSDPERALARRLAVFPAGATLAAAEQVCADAMSGAALAGGLARADVLPVLSGLVAKSILIRSDNGRYRMLDTVRAYCLERLAEAGEETRLKDVFAAYYLDFAEAADPRLRTADQVYWFHEFTAEQDNLHAALRWNIAKREPRAALRLVRSLGYYWVQNSHGEGDTLAREALALDPPALDKTLAEGRVIGSLIAVSRSWDVESVRGPLASAIAALEPWRADYAGLHPLAALAESVLLLYDGEQERTLEQYERFAQSANPWLRAMGLLYRAGQVSNLGRLDGAEGDCREALRLFRSVGERWGTALVLTQLVEFTELRADHQASIAALDEAAGVGHELGTWSDLSYVEGKLAVVRARAGDVARGTADFALVERAIAARGGRVDTDRWVAFMRAELAWRRGDLATAARSCETVLAAIDGNEALWWQSLRALLKTRLAMAKLGLGDPRGSGVTLAEALAAATTWPEHPTLAAVLDACAAYSISRGHPADVTRAAELLGAAHAVRGTFDESSLDAPPTREAAKAALGTQAYESAYQRGRRHTFQTASTLAAEQLAEVASAR
jgi:predicted ATPase/DNA-binding SARP family transcriptional activator